MIRPFHSVRKNHCKKCALGQAFEKRNIRSYSFAEHAHERQSKSLVKALKTHRHSIQAVVSRWSCARVRTIGGSWLLRPRGRGWWLGYTGGDLVVVHSRELAGFFFMPLANAAKLPGEVDIVCSSSAGQKKKWWVLKEVTGVSRIQLLLQT